MAAKSMEQQAQQLVEGISFFRSPDRHASVQSSTVIMTKPLLGSGLRAHGENQRRRQCLAGILTRGRTLWDSQR